MPRGSGGRTLSAPRPRRTEHARFHEKQKRAGRGYRVLPVVEGERGGSLGTRARYFTKAVVVRSPGHITGRVLRDTRRRLLWKGAHMQAECPQGVRLAAPPWAATSAECSEECRGRSRPW